MRAIKRFVPAIRHSLHQALGEGKVAMPVSIPTEKRDWDYPSFAALLPYRYVDTKQHVFINEGSLGMALELGGLNGADEKLIDGIESCLRNKLPDHIDVQLLLIATPQVGDQIDQALSPYDAKGGVFGVLAKWRRAYYQQAACEGFPNPLGYPATLRRYRVIACFAKRSSYSEQAVSELNTVVTTFQREWKALGILSLPVSVERFLPLIYDGLQLSLANPYASAITYDPHEPLNQQVVHPSFALEVEPEQLTVTTPAENGIGSQQRRLIHCGVDQYPDQFSLYQGGDYFAPLSDKLKAITSPFILSMSLRRVPTERAKSLANRRYFDFDKKAHSVFAKLFPKTVKAAAEWKRIRDELDQGSVGMMKGSMAITLITTPEKQAEALTQATSCFAHSQFKISPQRYRQLPGLLAQLPFGLSEGGFEELGTFGRLKTLTTFQAANLLPLQTDATIGTKGTIVTGFRHQMAAFDLFDSPLPVKNYNVAIAAASGSGKSFLVQPLIQQTLVQHGKAWVIDIGDSYKKFCGMLGGTYVDAGNLPLNPFTHVTDIQSSAEMIRDLLAVAAAPNTNLTDVDRALLLNAVCRAYEKAGQQATIDHVIGALEQAQASAQQTGREDVGRYQDLMTLLKPYGTDGIYGTVFNAPSNLDPDANFVVLELGSLQKKPALMKAVLYAIMLYIAQQMYHSPRSLRKLCVIDEAWKLLSGSNQAAASFIEQGFRTARRHKGSFIAISQSVFDFLNTPESKAAWDNADTKFILNQGGTFDTLLAKHPSLYSAYEQAIIKKLVAAQEAKFSEFLLCAGEHRSAHRLFVDPFSRILYSSKGEEFQAVDDLQKAGVPLPEAIERVASATFPAEMQRLQARLAAMATDSCHNPGGPC